MSHNLTNPELAMADPGDAPVESASGAELRVLSGSQAGARLRLPLGTYGVGTTDDCDIILADLSVEAGVRLVTLRELEWSIEQPGKPPLEMPFGADLELDGVRLTFARGGEPGTTEGWGDERLARASAAAAAGAPIPREGAEPSIASTRRGGRSTVKVFGAIGLVALLGCAVVGAAASVGMLAPAASTSSMDKPGTMPTEQSLYAILGELGIGSTVQVAGSGEAGGLALLGYVTRATDVDKVRKAVARYQGRVSVDIHADEVVRERALMVLGDHVPRDAVSVSNGVVEIRAPLAKSESDLKATLASAGVEYRSLVIKSPLGRRGAEVARPDGGRTAKGSASEAALTRLRSMLASAGLAEQARASLIGGVIEVRGELSGKELELAREVFLRFGQETQGDVEFVADFKERPVNRLPFRVVQVVGGPQPYVVTDRKEKIYVGAEHRKFKLVSMQDGRILFAGAYPVELKW